MDTNAVAVAAEHRQVMTTLTSILTLVSIMLSEMNAVNPSEDVRLTAELIRARAIELVERVGEVRS